MVLLPGLGFYSNSVEVPNKLLVRRESGGAVPSFREKFRTLVVNIAMT